MANLQMLANIAKNGGRGFLLGDNCIVTAIKDCEISFSEKMSGTISVFCFEKASGVNIKGLKYCVSDFTLTPDYPIGVSNSFTEEKAIIGVDNGLLLIFWYDTAEHFENYCESFLI